MSLLGCRHRCRSGIALAIAVLLAALTDAAVLAQAVATPAPGAAAKSKNAAETALPSPRKIIDRHIAAIGGRAAILARSSTHATGTLSVPSAGMTGSVDVFAAKPDKSLQRMTLGGIGAIEEGFDGKVGWSMSPMTGPALVEGKALEQKQFDSDFVSDLHLDSRYESMSTVEKTDFEGRPCYKLRLVRKGGGEDFEFYDVATGLKAGGITTRESPMGPITETSTESDYKPFGPLLQATTFKSSAMGVQQVITLTAIEYDKVDPATFEPPPAIKALLK